MQGPTHQYSGLAVTDHLFTVPLDHFRPQNQTLSVFAREAVSASRVRDNLPWLLFLQGGPGFCAPRPIHNSGWLRLAANEFRVLLLDQRGTGRSTALDAESLHGVSASSAAEYLKHFRADSIVSDCELIRQELAGDEPWSLLGQSFGGFCAVHYLSAAPQGLRQVMIAGGLPPLQAEVDDIYRRTYARVIERNQQYYKRYPQDMEIARAVASRLATSRTLLPCGDVMTPHRFQQLGICFGTSGGFEKVHYLLEFAFEPRHSPSALTYRFLHGCENAQPFDTNPLYALLHEACYLQQSASRWAAHRVRADFPQFAMESDGPVYFTGEMIFPWMFEEMATLAPLRQAAEFISSYDKWPPLYDGEQLRRNTVPCSAVIYADDMYVERFYAEETAQRIGEMRVWLTNEYEHDGLHYDGEAVLSKLLALVRGAA